MLQRLKEHLPTHVFAELQSIDLFPDKLTSLRSLNTPLRLAHFLAQVNYESGGFKHVEENLHYSWERLRLVYTRYFPNDKMARDYAGSPIKVASRVYANCMGNGNEDSRDGYTYRGRGYLLLTGKKNYQRFFVSVGLKPDSNPDLVAKQFALTSAAWFFDDNQLWKWCDVGPGSQAVFDVTKRVNGGTQGMDQRIELFNNYYVLLK